MPPLIVIEVPFCKRIAPQFPHRRSRGKKWARTAVNEKLFRHNPKKGARQRDQTWNESYKKKRKEKASMHASRKRCFDHSPDLSQVHLSPHRPYSHGRSCWTSVEIRCEFPHLRLVSRQTFRHCALPLTRRGTGEVGDVKGIVKEWKVCDETLVMDDCGKDG